MGNVKVEEITRAGENKSALGQDASSIPTKNKRVLVVDDSALVRKVLSIHNKFHKKPTSAFLDRYV